MLKRRLEEHFNIVLYRKTRLVASVEWEFFFVAFFCEETSLLLIQMHFQLTGIIPVISDLDVQVG